MSTDDGETIWKISFGMWRCSWEDNIKPLNAELNPICCLLALLGAHHFLHVSRIRVKTVVGRLLLLVVDGIGSEQRTVVSLFSAVLLSDSLG